MGICRRHSSETALGNPALLNTQAFLLQVKEMTVHSEDWSLNLYCDCHMDTFPQSFTVLKCVRKLNHGIRISRVLIQSDRTSLDVPSFHSHIIVVHCPACCGTCRDAHLMLVTLLHTAKI